MGKTNKTTTTTSYEPIAKNIYFDGASYRVRVSVNGTRYSKNFKSKKKAYEYRRSLAS